MAKAGRNLEKKESSLMFRQISPPHKWDQDLHSHYLRLTVPGFASADITLHMDKYGHLLVRGSREVTQHKYLSFEETFDVPDDANLEHAEGLFQDDQIYCVTIPKNKKLGQTDRGDGGVKWEDPKKDYKKGHDDQSMCPKPAGLIGSHNEPSHPSPALISMHNSKNKIAFVIAILVAIYVACLSRA